MINIEHELATIEILSEHVNQNVIILFKFIQESEYTITPSPKSYKELKELVYATAQQTHLIGGQFSVANYKESNTIIRLKLPLNA